MTSKTFNNLSKQYLNDKKEMDTAIQNLLDEEPDFTKKSLNSLNALSINFFTNFELFLTNTSSQSEEVSKIQLDDILTSIENVLNFSISYWEIIEKVSISLQTLPIVPQENFLKTSQMILKTYREDNALEIKEKFTKHSIPITGFTSKERYKMTNSSIDWVSLIMGAILIGITLIIIFILKVEDSMAYWITRILGSLGAGFLLTGVGGNTIQAKFTIPSLVITAIGSIAVFIFLYTVNPAEEPKFKNHNSSKEVS